MPTFDTFQLTGDFVVQSPKGALADVLYCNVVITPPKAAINFLACIDIVIKEKQPRIAEYKQNAYALITPATKAQEFKQTAYAPLRRNFAARTQKNTGYVTIWKNLVTKDYKQAGYSVIKPPPKSKVSKETGYSVLQRNPAQRGIKVTQYTVHADPNIYNYALSPLDIVVYFNKQQTFNLWSDITLTFNYTQTFNTIADIVIQKLPPQFTGKAHKQTGYVLIKTSDQAYTPVRAYKTTQYAVMHKIPKARWFKGNMYIGLYVLPAAREFRQAAYACVTPTRVFAYKNTAYAPITQLPPVKNYKVTGYSVFAKLPPARVYKSSAYTVFGPHMAAYGYKVSAYSVHYAMRMREYKQTGFCVVRPHTIQNRKTTSFVCLFTDQFLRTRKQNSYTVLQYVESPTKTKKQTAYVPVVKQNQHAYMFKQGSYAVFTSEREIAKTIKQTLYASIKPFALPQANVLFKNTSYVVFSGHYTVGFKISGYGVLQWATIYTIKTHRCQAFAVLAPPPERPNTTWRKIRGETS